MYNDNRMAIEKQFKADMGITVAEAEMKLSRIKANNNELFNLRCSLSGFCSSTNEKLTLSEDERVIVRTRIEELELI